MMAPKLPSVLVVDDVADNLEVIRSILANLPVRLLMAQSGEEALSLVVSEEELPILALLDVQMPNMDGYELASLLRSVQRTREIPIIFVSAVYRDESHVLKGYDTGAIDYLIKPINDVLLRSKVKIFIELAQFKQERLDYQSQLEQTVIQRTTELQQQQQRLSDILWGTNVGTWEWNIQTGETRFNQRWAEMIGYTLSELEPISIETWRSLCHPEDLLKVETALHQHFTGELPQYECEVRMRHKESGWLWALDRGRVIRWTEGGRPLWMSGTHLDINERKQAQLQIEALLDRFQKIAHNVPGMLYQLQQFPDGRMSFPYSTDGIKAIYGVSPQDVVDDASVVMQVLHTDDVERVVKVIQHSAKTLTTWHDQYRAILPDGKQHWLEGEAQPEAMADGSVLWHGYIHDVTARVEAEQQLQQAASVFEYAREGIMITDGNANIIDVNRAFCQITGYDRDEVIGQNPRMFKSGCQDAAFYQVMWQELTQKGQWSGEIWNRRKNGEVYAELLTISAVCDQRGLLLRYVALFSDISSIKEHQLQLERIAHYDALTHLPNRLLLSDRLLQAMNQAIRYQHRVAVVYLDLDGFKAVNDCFGHEAGDYLLIKTTDRMKQALRECDTLARLGGDEFVVVLPALDEIESCHTIINRLLLAACEPVEFNQQLLKVSASIGVTFYPQNEEMDADQLLRQADQAMYQAKQAGKNRCCIFDTEHDLHVRSHHANLEQIRQALYNQEFVLYYQPKVNMRSGEVLGVEALIRWQHPERGILPPSEFLPIIDGNPLSLEVGSWVLQQALKQFDLWFEQGLSVPISINIDGNQLKPSSFLEELKIALAQHPHVGIGDLELEVLESSALADMDQISQVLLLCQEIGVDAALDDFGTGYSSLSYLKRLPVNLLKIDQSFVRDMLVDEDDLSIIEAVVGLAQAFEREVIAEGVETEAHGVKLLQLGCNYGQGYAIARPMPASHVVEWIKNWQVPASWRD